MRLKYWSDGYASLSAGGGLNIFVADRGNPLGLRWS